ncbi:MAG: hypothetical protein AAFX06_04970 [Planctomycetota bacterium]
MSSAPTTSDQLIDQRIDEARRALWWGELIRTLLAVAIGSMIAILAWLLFDHWVYASGPLLRTVSFVVLAAAAAWFLVRRVWPVLTSRVTEEYAAWALEQGHEDYRQQLTSYVTLKPDGPVKGLRARIVSVLGSRAAGLLKTHDELPAEATGTFRWWIAAALVFAMLMAYIVGSPKSSLASAHRLIAPLSAIDPAQRVSITDVEPGDGEALAGRSVAVSAQIEGLRREEAAYCRWVVDGAEFETELTLEASTGLHQGELELPHSASGLVLYRLEAGDAVAGPYRLDVENVPVVAIENVYYQPPKYTGRRDKTLSSPSITAIDGTKIRVTAKTNRAVERAEIQFNPKRLGSVVRATAGRREMEIGSDGMTLTAELTLRSARGNAAAVEPETYRIRVWDSNEQSNPEPIIYPIRIIPDLPPEVAIVVPQKSPVEVPFSAQQIIEVHAMDADFELQEVALRIDRGIDTLSEPLIWLRREGESGRGNQVMEYRFRPSEHPVNVGDTVRITAIALDNREIVEDPSVEPNRSETDPVEIRITEDATELPEDPSANDGLSRPDDRPASDVDRSEQGEGGEQGESGGKGGASGEQGDASKSGSGQQGEGAQDSGASQQGEGAQESGAGQQGEGAQESGAGQQGEGAQESGANQQGEGAQESGGGQQGEGAQESGAPEREQSEGAEESGTPQQGENGSGGESGESSPSGDPQQGMNRNPGDSRQPGQDPSGQQGQPPGGSDAGNEGNKSGAGEQGRDPSGGEQNASGSDPGSGSESQAPPKHDGEAFERIKDFVENKRKQQGQDSPGESSGDRGQQQPRDDTAGQSEKSGQRGDMKERAPKSEGGQQGERGSEAGNSGEQGDKSQSGDSEPGDSESGDSGETGNSDSSPEQPKPDGDSMKQSGEQRGDARDPEGDGSEGEPESSPSGDQPGEQPNQDPSGKGSDSPNESSSGPQQGEPGSSQETGEGQGDSDAMESSQNGQESGGQGNESDNKSNEGSSGESSKSNSETGERSQGDSSDAGESSSSSDPSNSSSSPSSDSSAKPSNSNPSDSASNGSGAGSGTTTGQQEDAANEPPPPDLEYAKKATDMVLDYLDETREQVDPELLKDLNWTEKDLERFRQRWQKVRDLEQAPANAKPSSELEDALKSLGLNPKQRGAGTREAADNFRSLRDSGNRRKAPAAFRDAFDAFRSRQK